MKVHELIEQLQQLPHDNEVILQIDPEGNGYRQISGAEQGIVEDSTSYTYDMFSVLDPSWTADEADMEHQEWEQIKQQWSRVIIIFP